MIILLICLRTFSMPENAYLTHRRCTALCRHFIFELHKLTTAKTQLPFWFELVNGDNIRFTGYKNTTAYPQPEWFAIPPDETPFDIKTQQKGHNGKPNQYVLSRPIRT